MEIAVADNTNKNAANSQFRKLRQAEDGKRAMLDYENNAAANRAKTTRRPPRRGGPPPEGGRRRGRAPPGEEEGGEEKTARGRLAHRGQRSFLPAMRLNSLSLIVVCGRSPPRAVSVCHLPLSSSNSISAVSPGTCCSAAACLRGLERGGVGRERLGEGAVDFVGPAAIVLDDLVGDFRHGAPFLRWLTLQADNLSRRQMVAQAIADPAVHPQRPRSFFKRSM